MAVCPQQALEVLTEFLRQFEAEGRWPEGWATNAVCLLPKGDPREAGDRRPIVLLSTIYRLWAATRAGAVRRWLRAYGIEQVGSRAAADYRAALLAIELAVAPSAGETVAGLAVDWSKCYDHVPLHVLQEIAERAGTTRATVSSWMPRLEARGLVRYVRDGKWEIVQ